MLQFSLLILRIYFLKMRLLLSWYTEVGIEDLLLSLLLKLLPISFLCPRIYVIWQLLIMEHMSYSTPQNCNPVAGTFSNQYRMKIDLDQVTSLWWNKAAKLHIANKDDLVKIQVIATYIQGRSRPCIPPWVMALSGMGLKFGIFGLLPTTHAKTNSKQLCPRSSQAVWHFTQVSRSDRSRCRWHTHQTNHGYFDYGKTQRPPI